MLKHDAPPRREYTKAAETAFQRFAGRRFHVRIICDMHSCPCVAAVLLCLLTHWQPAAGVISKTSPKGVKTYTLATWTNASCRAKGRFQDRDYCHSAVIDQIVADGKDAIPALISQITDSRFIAEPVFDFWPRIRTGELAYFILSDLFLDETWQKTTMPDLFPSEPCKDPAWVCWAKFRKKHVLKELQSRWMNFWTTNQENIYWDKDARCFRLHTVTKPH